MADEDLQRQVNEISGKLDLILKEIELQRRHREEMEDLKEDLMRVGKDVFQTAVVELEEVHDSMKTGDVIHLGKRVLRNLGIIEKSFEQLESIRDFLQDASPLAREYFLDFMKKLDEFDRKGYFRFFRESSNILDKIVTSFSPEDINNLADNIVTILNTVKNLTQPDMLQTINTAVNVYKKLDIEIKDDVSLYRLLKELNTPEAKKGLAFAVEFLKSLSRAENEAVFNKTATLQIN
jgi:uncharacterized protein YjgD (DUF1641 family)